MINNKIASIMIVDRFPIDDKKKKVFVNAVLV